MDASAVDFLKHVLDTPSPSGYEAPVQKLVREYLADAADEMSTDVHGNVIAVKNPGAPLRLMLAGHSDQIGLVVQFIDNDGFIYAQPIGGWDAQVLIGQRMTVWTADGAVNGVIARKPIHLLTDEERKQVVKLKDLWIDIGAKDKADAESVIQVGDPVTMALGYHELRNGRAAASGMDDKSGLWVVAEAFRRAEKAKLACSLYCVATVQEEVGLRGARTSAFGIDPQAGVAVDVTHATDCPTIDKKQEGDVKLGGGPVIYRGPNMNRKLTDQLVALAREHSIPYQLAAEGRATGTDANAMQISRGGMATGLVSVPNRYMHSPVEVIDLKDIDCSATLLARFAESVAKDADFTP